MITLVEFGLKILTAIGMSTIPRVRLEMATWDFTRIVVRTFNFTPAITIGINTLTPGGILSVEGAGNPSGIFVKAACATTYSAIQVEADALTTGSMMLLLSSSASTSTRQFTYYSKWTTLWQLVLNGLRIQQDSTAPALIALGNVSVGD